MKIEKYRDLSLIDINEYQKLVVSCDSSGGIGEKENDVVKTTAEVVGYFSTQVALMENISFGAKPITIINTLSVEMNDTGKKVLDGIKRALDPLDLDEKIIITGSTEENFPVSVTGVGITVIGIIDKNDWKKPQTNPGMLAVVVGLPKVGDEVLANEDKIMDISNLIELKKKDYIGEILPVGSKGVLYELKEMSKSSNVNFVLEDDIDIDLNKSAGPSTCVIISIEDDKYEKLREELILPIKKIAKFI